MKWIFWALKKIFLAKTIVSQNGELHFKRFRLFACPWLRIYLHKIYLPDYDAHMHSHPWNFYSFILKGSYLESFSEFPYYTIKTKLRPSFSLIQHDRLDVHQIESLDGPVWSLVFSYGSKSDWGYQIKTSESSPRLETFVDHRLYRHLKNDGHFDEFGRYKQ